MKSDLTAVMHPRLLSGGMMIAVLLLSACSQAKDTQLQTSVAAPTARSIARHSGSSPAPAHAGSPRRAVAARQAISHTAPSLPKPVAIATPGATARATAANVPASAPVSDSLTGVVVRAPHAAPAIMRVALPTMSVTPGQIVRASVYTTSNTASVEARLYGYGMPLRRVGVGHFRLVYQVPAVPDYLKRTWPVQVIARNADGVSSSKQIMINVH